MEAEDILRLVYDDLAPFVATLRGSLSVAADPWDFLEQLAQSPKGFACVLHWEGDNNRVSSNLEGVFADNWLVCGVALNPGLGIKPDAALFRDRADGAPSLLKLQALLKAQIRGLTITREEQDSETSLMYLGAKPVVLPDGIPLRAYALRFSLTACPTPVVYHAPA